MPWRHASSCPGKQKRSSGPAVDQAVIGSYEAPLPSPVSFCAASASPARTARPTRPLRRLPQLPPECLLLRESCRTSNRCDRMLCRSSLPSSAESSFVFTLVPARQLQIIQRRLLRFLDEAMQQNHSPLRINVEQYPRDAILREMRPYFADAATEGSAYRHPDRPSKFDCLDILTDEPTILGRLQAL